MSDPDDYLDPANRMPVTLSPQGIALRREMRELKALVRAAVREYPEETARLLREMGYQVAPAEPLKLIETASGEYSLLLNTTPVDDVIKELGHRPSGYFWVGVAKLLVSQQAPHLAGRVSYDPEGDMFCADSGDRAALEELGALMSVVATDRDRMRELITSAQASGFEFGD